MDLDEGCPWCGESGEDMRVSSGMRTFDAALEAHVPECEPAMAELGDV